MSIEAWPFLVSRNRYIDYRTVVAPDFICDAKIANLLARVTEGDLTEPGKGFLRHIYGSKIGSFTIVYRVLKATEKDLNYQGGDEIIKDQNGREIYLIEGFVIQGIKSKEEIYISHQNIEEIHLQLTEANQTLWKHIEPHLALPASIVTLSMDTNSSSLELEELEPFQEKYKKKGNQNSKGTENNSRIPMNLRFNGLFIKSKVKYIVFIVFIIVLLMIAFRLPNILFPSAANIYDCTTSQEYFITSKNINNIKKFLNKLQQDYPDAVIFLDGSLKVKSPTQWQSLTKRQKLDELESYTINLYGDIVQLQDHPLDLAISQLRNQKIVDYTTIKAKIINRRKCTKN